MSWGKHGSAMHAKQPLSPVTHADIVSHVCCATLIQLKMSSKSHKLHHRAELKLKEFAPVQKQMRNGGTILGQLQLFNMHNSSQKKSQKRRKRIRKIYSQMKWEKIKANDCRLASFRIAEGIESLSVCQLFALSVEFHACV